MPSLFARTPFGLPYTLLVWVLGTLFWLMVVTLELRAPNTVHPLVRNLVQSQDGLAAGVFLLLFVLCAFLRRRSEFDTHPPAEDGLMVLFVLVFPKEITVLLLGVAGVLEAISQQTERLQKKLPVGSWSLVFGEVLFHGSVTSFIGLTGSTVEQVLHGIEWHLRPQFHLRELATIPLVYLSVFVMRVSVSWLTLWMRGGTFLALWQEARATQSVITFLAEFATVVLSIMIAVVYARLDFLPVLALGTVLVALVALLSQQAEALARQQRTIAEMKMLVGVGRALSNPAQTRRELLRAVYQEGRDLFRADSLAVYLFSEDGGRSPTLEWQSVAPTQPQHERRGQERQLHESGQWSSTGECPTLHPEMDALGLAEWCVQHKQALRLGDLEREASLYGYRWLTERLPYRSWMGVPLEAEKNTLGVISVASHRLRAFSEQDETMLRALGQQLVGALESARLYELATVDSLTGLLNARTIRAKLTEIFAKTLASKGQMAVLMVDIDYFKRVNDTYGHEVGNEVLRHVAKLVRSKLRDTDLPGRYGGEEFLIVLPNTPAKGAMDVAERLRRHIAARPAATAAGDLSITASFGVASIPKLPAAAPDQLIEAADKALYESKRNGRNCVTEATLPT